MNKNLLAVFLIILFTNLSNGGHLRVSHGGRSIHDHGHLHGSLHDHGHLHGSLHDHGHLHSSGGGSGHLYRSDLPHTHGQGYFRPRMTGGHGHFGRGVEEVFSGHARPHSEFGGYRREHSSGRY